jgi:hypothetical protein
MNSKSRRLFRRRSRYGRSAGIRRPQATAGYNGQVLRIALKGENDRAAGPGYHRCRHLSGRLPGQHLEVRPEGNMYDYKDAEGNSLAFAAAAYPSRLGELEVPMPIISHFTLSRRSHRSHCDLDQVGQ